MKKKLSSVTFWLLVFFILVAVQTYSAMAQASAVRGYWTNGSVGSIQYQNRVTGSTRPGRGSHFSYKFLANGTYTFVGYMDTTMYNCTTTLFNEITGEYTVDGSTIHLDPTRDFWKNTNTCAASGNKQQTKTPTKKSVEFVVKEDDYGKTLLCLNEGSGESCFRKEEQ